MLVVVGLASCRGGTDHVGRPGFDPDDAGEMAIELYDKNGDGALDDEELRLAPGIADGKSRADVDGDGRVSADEIAQRVERWMNSNMIIAEAPTVVSLDGRPLADATVTFEPEPILKDWISTASGETDSVGNVVPVAEGAPAPGVYLGYYRIKVSKIDDGKETIPARYNEQTELGTEITDDRPPTTSGSLQLQLRSR